MASDFNSDPRLSRLRRLTTAAIAADITTHLISKNAKRDDFTTGQLLITSEAIETTWLKTAGKLQTYADQGKLFKSSMYKLKLETFLRAHTPVQPVTKIKKMETDIDEIKKQLQILTKKRKRNDG